MKTNIKKFPVFRLLRQSIMELFFFAFAGSYYGNNLENHFFYGVVGAFDLNIF